MTIDFDKLYKRSILKGEELSAKPPAIRASSLPFCPKEFILSYIEFLQGDVKWSFQGDFFCDIGTSVHNAVQNWIPKVVDGKGILLGNWRCDRCSTPKKSKKGIYYLKPYIVYNKVGPIDCDKCGKPMQYEEFELKPVDAFITGHCDGVLLDIDYIDKALKKYYSIDMTKNDNNVYEINRLIMDKKLRKHIKIPAYVLELKTSSSFNIRQLNKPKHEYHCQASFYTSVLQKVLRQKFNICTVDIQGYVIKYIARDNPHLVSKDFCCSKNDSIYNANVKLINLFWDSILSKNYSKIYKVNPCVKYPDIYSECDYTSFCNEMSKKDFKGYCIKVKKKLKLKKVNKFYSEKQD